MFSRYTSYKRVPKKRTKKRQTKVKRQGIVETSRLKLEIVETSRLKLEVVETSRIKLEINEAFSISDLENTQKGTTTTTSGTSRKKGTITKGKKTGKRSENTAIRRIQLVGQIATHRIAIALKYTLKQK